MLNNNWDLKTLLWMVAATGLFFYLWNSPEFSWLLYGVYIYFSIAFSVFAHNHNHLPVWKNKFINQLHSCWITLFYGFPTFAWIPTHNKNHHRHNNKDPDYTKTYMSSERNNILTLLIYPKLSGRAQLKPVIDYYKAAYKKPSKKFFYYYTMQIVCLVSWVVVALIFNWKKALVYVVIPQQVSVNVVLLFNYIQHVHADEESEFNHSRNIVGKMLNFFLFNNGYHTVHHMQPGLHWSTTPAAHKKVAHLIDPKLQELSMMWYFFRIYFLGIFLKSCRTDSMRLARQKSESTTA